MSVRRVLSATAGVVATAALVSACGGGAPASNGLVNKSSKQIITAALGAMSGATSTRLSGSVDSGTQHLTIDLTMFKNGDTDGTFGLSTAPGHLVIVGKDIYFSGTAAFWEALTSGEGSTMPAAIAANLAGKWVLLPASADSSFDTLTLAYFVKSVRTSSSKLVKAGRSTIDGQKTVGVKGSQEGLIWVSATGTPYPVEATQSTSAGSTEKLTFSDWNQGTAPTKPKGAEPYATLIG